MKETDVTSAFRSVDTLSDIDYVVHFLDRAGQNPSVKDCKRYMEAQMHIRPGDRILDFGCGTGNDVRRLAELTGNKGLVTGIDISKKLIEIARSRHSETDLPITFTVASADELPFEDASFDICRAERLLMHVADPAKVIDEMLRVTRPGGRIVIFDIAFDATATYHTNREFTRRIIRYVSDNIANGWIGSHLGMLLKTRRAEDVKVIPHTLTPDYEFLKFIISPVLTTAVENGIFKQQEIDHWWAELAKAQQQDYFLYTFQGFIVSGKKAGR
ncbi:methyltransferase domain-containing protein [Sinomicrobium kalidii]|uniref:methyltransferase domain-containing protein n=1 Tax=Sinomicrobium kalidii TaxID=2900738 RepID=UPI001E2E0958|nr:methyltransferase domain-containing protein [Sinomicrobium kalidii]UGU17077.1 methyltransferase domain-containing protein [Sinomicrobium kalidii]